MTENHEPEVQQAPDPATFDLDTWLKGHQTYPRYSATVHMDGHAVKENNRLVDEARELRDELNSLENSVGKSMDGSLADASAATRQHKALARIKEIKAEREAVYARAKASALTLHFRARDARVYKRVREALAADFPESEGLGQADLQKLFTTKPEVADRQQALMVSMTLDEVTNADGVSMDMSTLTVPKIEALLEAMSSADRGRVYENMNMAVIGAGSLEDQIDAGFPG